MSKVNEHRPGYKRTPLGWIPEEWEVKEVGQIAKISSGGTPDRKNANYWNGSIPWISTSLIDFNTITLAAEYITEQGLINSSAKMFEPGAILMAMYGQGKTRGKVARLGIPACTNQACAAIIVDGKADANYLFQYFVHNYTNIRRLSNTGSQENLNGELIKSINLKLPTNFEQRKIASILSTWDEAIAKTQQLIVQLQQRNKGLMQQLLTGQKKLKGFEKNKWEFVSMNSLFERVQRKAKIDNENIEVLTISGRFGFLSQKEKFNRVIAGNSLKNYTLLKKGEFSYNKGNSTAYQYGCVFRLDHYTEAMVPNVYISFKSIANIDTTFYTYYFKHDLLKPSLAKIISSGARMDGLLNVNADDFLKIKVPLPTLEEQQKIGCILECVHKELKFYEQQHNALQQQKKGLMQKLLTGEVRVNIVTEQATI
jgi:type I restriction enzyme S subunit